MSTVHLEVLRAGPLTTVQDRGRPGWAHLGVPRAGALDAGAAALANRLVGNPAEAAVLETTFGGLAVRLSAGRWCALSGAAGGVEVDGRPRGLGRAEWVPRGSVLTVSPPATGVRAYLAVDGGLAVPPVLGSRSTDVLAGVGPPVVRDGDRLPLGAASGHPAAVEAVQGRRTGPLRVHPGPRADWLEPGAPAGLCATAYEVGEASNRVALRLVGPALARTREGELPSEGLVAGAVQVPPDGRPIVFLADHPTTGGYPVVAVVDRGDLDRCAQLRPGERVSFVRAR